MGGLALMPIRFDVAPLLAQLECAPELWNNFDLRTNHPRSPHRELDDIFVRYNARENFTGDRARFNEEHDAVWWPTAQMLPAARDLSFELMSKMQGERLGMVLITRIPAGAQCYPHTDTGWHARHYDKFAIQLASEPAQSFHVEDEVLRPAPGECYWFDNSRPHHVLNPTDHARMTMIICIRNRFTGVRV